jgi:hypothetical protein
MVEFRSENIEGVCDFLVGTAEQVRNNSIIADHRLAGSRDVDVPGGRDSTPSMGVIVARIIRRRVGRLSGKAEPPLVWCSGLFLF